MSELRGIHPSAYPHILDEWTCNLTDQLPKGANKWGTARKAINVFMIQIFLNRFLAKEYDLEKLRDVLETPLDYYAAKGLRKWLRRLNLTMEVPRWEGIKNLTAKASEKYQECASEVAKERHLSRAHMDMILWRVRE